METLIKKRKAKRLKIKSEKKSREEKPKEKIVLTGIRLPVPKKVAVDSLMSIYARNNNQLTPKAVVREAKQKNHPLHRCFEWNDKKAGDQYRLYQARKIISCVHISTHTNDNDPIMVRAFVNIKNDENNALTHNPFFKGDSYYVSMKDAMNDNFLRAYTVEQALGELDIWMKKYKAVKELSSLFELIDSTQ